MSSNDVAERRALVQHVVPGEGKITFRARSRPVFHSKIGYHPRSELKLANVRRRIFPIWPDGVAGHELRRCKDDLIGSQTTRVAPFALDRNYVYVLSAIFCHRYQFDCGAAKVYLRLNFLKQVIDQTPVALRPCDQRL